MATMTITALHRIAIDVQKGVTNGNFFLLSLHKYKKYNNIKHLFISLNDEICLECEESKNRVLDFYSHKCRCKSGFKEDITNNICV